MEIESASTSAKSSDFYVSENKNRAEKLSETCKKFNDNDIKLLTKLINNIRFRLDVFSAVKNIKKSYTLRIHPDDEHTSTLKVYLNPKQEFTYEIMYIKCIDEYVYLIPKEDVVKKLLLKVNFFDSKGKIVISHRYKTAYEDGIFFNIVDLKKMMVEEEKNEVKFKYFLKGFLGVGGENLGKREGRSKERINKECLIKEILGGERHFSVLKKGKNNLKEKKISFGMVQYSY